MYVDRLGRRTNAEIEQKQRPAKFGEQPNLGLWYVIRDNQTVRQVFPLLATEQQQLLSQFRQELQRAKTAIDPKEKAARIKTAVERLANLGLYKEILNCFVTRLTNGYGEGLNNKTRTNQSLGSIAR